MTSVKKVSEKQQLLDSLCARLDGKKGMIDDTRKWIVEPSAMFASAKGNRLVGCLEWLRKHAAKVKDSDDLRNYAKHVADGKKVDLGHLTQCFGYWQRSPKAVKAFLGGLYDESALRYAGADVSTVRIGSAERGFQFVNLTGKDGGIVTRYQFLEEKAGSMQRQAKKQVDADGKKWARTNMVPVVESAAQGLVTPEVAHASALRVARETAVKAITARVTDAKSQSIPNTPEARDAYTEQIRRLVSHVPDCDLAVVTNKEIASLRGGSKSAERDAHFWRTLMQIAEFGGIPKGMSPDDPSVTAVFKLVGKLQPLTLPFLSGELRAGVPVNGKARVPVAAD